MKKRLYRVITPQQQTASLSSAREDIRKLSSKEAKEAKEEEEEGRTGTTSHHFCVFSVDAKHLALYGFHSISY